MVINLSSADGLTKLEILKKILKEDDECNDLAGL